MSSDLRPSRTEAYALYGKNRNASETEPFVRGVIGSTVLLLLAVAIERLFFGAGYFSSLAQHPFWIVVLLAASVEGLFVGVATACIAALMMDWPPRPIGVDIADHYIAVSSLPLQWLLAALCIGLFRHSEIRSQRQVMADNLHLREVNETLAEEVRRVDEALEQAEMNAFTKDEAIDSSTRMTSELLALQNARSDEVEHRFDEIAALWTPLPADLLIARNANFFECRSEAPIVRAMNLTGKTHANLREKLTESAAPVTVNSADYTDLEDRMLVIAGIPRRGDGELAGLVVLVAETEADAEANVPVAGLLATTLAPALALREKLVPLGTERANPKTIAGGRRV